MPGDWPLTLGAALALLSLGILIGRLWVLLRRPRGQGRGHRERPHYLLGLNYLISNQPDLAIGELSQAVSRETDAVEAYLALGNLFREKGATERAIDVHKSLLHRADLSQFERLQVLLSLGLDFKKAGLVDRAERTLCEVVQRNPDSIGGLRSLRQVYEEMGRWEDAAHIERRIQALAGSRDDHLLASLYCEWGRELWVAEDRDTAERHYRAALDLEAELAPARIGLAECLLHAGDAGDAAEHLERALAAGPPWSVVALGRLADACARLDDPMRLESACTQVLEADPRSWRAHLEMGRLKLRQGDAPAAREALLAAARERPGSLAVQQELLEAVRADGAELGDFADVLEHAGREARLADPFVCLSCRVKSAELFARCPHCHEWDTMAEERQ